MIVMLNDASIPASAEGLLDLPMPLIGYILRVLDLEQQLRAALTCHLLSSVVSQVGRVP